MNQFTRNIAPYVEDELAKARDCIESGRPDAAFVHLENAHVLGQGSTYWHVIVHARMLLWAIRQKDTREIRGQVIRIIGAAALTWIMAVPKGNTGGSKVSAVKVMTIKPELEKIIEEARR